MHMESNKCSKYIYKLQNTSVNDKKFGVYLTKLNHWHSQTGGAKFRHDIKIKLQDHTIIPILKSI